MRLSTIASVAGIFALAAGGAYVSAQIAATWIERSTVDQVERQLSLDGFSWASVATDGLQVILEGEAPSEAERFKVLSSVGSVVEAARVYDNFSVTESSALAAPDFSIEILRNSGGISLIGLIPAAVDRAALLEQIQSRASGVQVADFMESADYPVPAGWDAASDFGIYALGELARTKITINAGKVFVAASAGSSDEKRRLEANLARRAPDNLQTLLDIRAPRPVITPFILRFGKDAAGTAKLDACSADTPETAARILKAVSNAGLEGKSECRQGLGVPSPNWPTAAEVGIAALSELGGGQLTMSDTDVTLVAIAGSDQAAFDAVVQRLSDDLPEDFVLNATLPELREDGDDKPIDFTATLSPERQLQMRGAIPDATAKDIMNTFAKAKFGSDGIFDSVALNDALPAGWTIRVLSGLEALSQLESGIVEVTGDTIQVSGRTGNPNLGAAVTQGLTKRLGQATKFDLNVTYDVTLDPVANRLKPAACVVEITKLVDAKKITFEPGSTVLDTASRATVDQIATTMKRCPDAEIEISGHTDSQGGEEMNQSLSQDRASAVLSALTLQRVKLKTLLAEGYGETQPIADNGTEVGREANRRIEFRLITPVPVPLDGEEEDTNEQN